MPPDTDNATLAVVVGAGVTRNEPENLVLTARNRGAGQAERMVRHISAKSARASTQARLGDIGEFVAAV